MEKIKGKKAGVFCDSANVLVIVCKEHTVVCKKNTMPIKFTKNQALILEIFFNDPEKSYYLRELARIIGKQPGVFQKDINGLVEKNILTSEKIANSRFFKLNKKYPLYDEIKSIFLKTSGVQGQLKNALKKIKNIKTAFIFGSFAKKSEDSFSDIDLMIIGNPDEDRLVEKTSKIEKKISREINYRIFSAADIKKRLEAKEVFLEEVLRGQKIFLIGKQDDLEKIIGK